MKAVATKVLKDNLSKYLRLVQDGETILVMDRDEVVAELRRPRYRERTIDTWAAFLADASERGAIQPAQRVGGPSLALLARQPRPQRPVDLQQLLDQIKAD